MSVRTDLISEIQNEKICEGILTSEEALGVCRLSTVIIRDSLTEKQIGKPKGKYCTVSFERLETLCDTEDIIESIIKFLNYLLPKGLDNTLIVGLGNTDITPDALGPLVANRILATRHLDRNFRRNLGLQQLRDVSCIIPGVLGKTGIESYDIIDATIKKTKPQAIIAIDALAARSPERLCRTIQMSDSGICPGSGVNNARHELSEHTFGVPVIAIGIPTVIDAKSLFAPQIPDEDMMVTPKEIDMLIEKSASILSKALNRFLQPEIDSAVLESLT